MRGDKGLGSSPDFPALEREVRRSRLVLLGVSKIHQGLILYIRGLITTAPCASN
jgi:hypothetical protein